MINEGWFKCNDLRLCDWQYAVRHESTDCFNIGETVFLKSNPESPMEVVKKKDEHLVCEWHSKDGILQTCEYYPQTILQYKFAGLKKFKREFDICIN